MRGKLILAYQILAFLRALPMTTALRDKPYYKVLISWKIFKSIVFTLSDYFPFPEEDK